MATVLFRCWTPSAARPPLPYQHQLQVRETKLILAKMIYRVSRNTGPIRGDNFCEPICQVTQEKAWKRKYRKKFNLKECFYLGWSRTRVAAAAREQAAAVVVKPTASTPHRPSTSRRVFIIKVAILVVVFCLSPNTISAASIHQNIQNLLKKLHNIKYFEQLSFRDYFRPITPAYPGFIYIALDVFSFFIFVLVIIVIPCI